MPEHEARMTALIAKWKARLDVFSAEADPRKGMNEQRRINGALATVTQACILELEALLTAGEDVALQGEPASDYELQTRDPHMKQLVEQEERILAAVEASPSRPMAPLRPELSQMRDEWGHWWVKQLDYDDVAQQIATLTAERDELLQQPYGKMRRALILRAEAAEARAIALEAELVALQTLLEQRASRFFDDHGEVDTEYVAAELRALLSPPPPSRETT